MIQQVREGGKTGRKSAQSRMTSIVKILDKKIFFVPEDIRPDRSDGKNFQLFEVVFAKLMSLSQSDFSWVVTPYHGDDGIDFLGEKKLFESIRPPMQALFVVGGQCKMRSGGADDPYKELNGDVGNMVAASKRISYAIVAYLSEVETSKLAKAIEKLEKIHRMTVCFFGIRDIAALIARHRPEIEALLDELNSAGEIQESEKQVVMDYFLASWGKVQASLTLIAKPEHARTGIPIEVMATFTSSLASLDRLRFRWQSALGAEMSTYMVLPTAALSEEGAALLSSDTFTYPIELTLVCYAPGPQSLGRLEILDGGEVAESLDLGEVEFADTFHPAFYWPPYETLRRSFAFEWDTVRAGAVRELAIIGHGGTGKTRFCQELAFIAQSKGGWTLSAAHPTNLQEPYRLLGDLAERLLPAEARLGSPKSSVAGYLQRLDPVLAEAAISSLDALYFDARGDGGGMGCMDSEAVVQTLQILFAASLRRGPLLLHICDLHWAMADTHFVIGETIRRLMQAAESGQLRHGLCIIYEGRVNETFVARQDQQEVDWSCAVFSDFLDQRAPAMMAMEGWSDEDCRGFLTNFFDGSQSGVKQVPIELVPHRERLVSQVLRFSAGNPQHMVEQIRLLRQKGILASNPRTGLLYAVDAELEDYHAPEKVLELIGQRFAHYQKTSPSLVRLLRLMALVSDRTEAGLFDALRARVAPDVTDAAIEATDFVLLPDRRGDGVRFRHENYFHAARGIVLPPEDRRVGVEIHLAWLDRLKRRSPQTQLLRATILSEAPEIDRPAIRKILRPALDKARRINQLPLALRIAEMLVATLSAMEDGGDRPLRLETGLLLVSLMTAVGNRRHAAEVAARIVDELDRDPLPASKSPWRGKALLPQRASLALAGSEINLMRASRSAERLKRLVGELERYEGIASGRDLSTLGALLCDSVNALSVACALAGDKAGAYKATEHNVAIARRIRDDVKLGKALMDLGNINLGDAPEHFAMVIDQGKALLADGPPNLRLLSQVHSVMGHMLARHRTGTDGPELYRDWFASLSGVLAEARAGGFVQEAGAAALMAGICQAMQGVPEAALSFMECIDVSYRGNHHETLWRAHINLAQVCLERGTRAGEEAAHHAGHALTLMSKGLGECIGIDREARLSFLRMGMAQVLRIWRATDDKRERELLSLYPDLAEFFSQTFHIPAHLKTRWDCVQRGEACLIFY